MAYKRKSSRVIAEALKRLAVTELVLLAVVKTIRISLLLTIILTGCANPPTPPPINEKALKRDEVFNQIAQEIIKSKKRTIAIIDFHDKDGKKIKDQEGEYVAEEMAVYLEKVIGEKKEKVWIESGKSLMNALEKHRIIENGTITNKELAKRLWQKMGIEAVITGVLDPHINWIGYSIELHDVQDDKVIHQFNENWQKEDVTTTKGRQSPESTKSSHGAYRPLTPSADEEISQHFLNPHEHATLADVGASLQKALRNAGFNNTEYLVVPEGFALVSSPDELRFSFDGTRIPPNATIGSNFRRLLKALKEDPFRTIELYFSQKTPNAYQVVCVIVTSGRVFYQDQPEMTFKNAQNLVVNGEITFPNELKNKKYNEDEHKCVVLLYAFEEAPSGDEIGSSGNKIRFISLTDPDNKIDIRERLQKTGFWE